PAEWEYLAEGNVHVVFRYVGNDTRLAGRALRIVKHEGDHALAQLAYATKVAAPLFGEHYIERSEPIVLAEAVAAKLKEGARCRRPVGRMQSDVLPWGSWAVLVDDLTMLVRPSPPPLPSSRPCAGMGCLTFEIKPKVGCMPCSWLVPPAHALKHRLPRFEALQRHKLHLAEHCGESPHWGAHGGPTLYRPADLFSGDADRVSAAITALFAAPHNKLRVFHNHVPVYGGACGADAAALELAAAAVLGTLPVPSPPLPPPSPSQPVTAATDNDDDTSERRGWVSALVATLSTVLLSEPLLARIITAQRLDLLDVEGAALVYERMRTLCCGTSGA
ncbi:unnamed protein product, partial [Phaeothamnion confervicola]